MDEPIPEGPTLSSLGPTDSAAPPPKSPPRPGPGDQLGPYRLERSLGAGAQGDVFEAVHRTLKRAVALKLIYAGDSPLDVQRFLREVKHAFCFSHPNVVRVYDAGNVDRIPYIAMELLTGETLNTLISRSAPLPATRAVEIVDQIAAGLDHLHSHNIIHRDIKPANLMLTTDGTAKILDFGTCRLQSGETLTAPGILVGTPYYMSPELFTGGRSGPETDLWSLGCVFYELLTGQTHHPRTHFLQWVRQVLQDPIQPPRVHRPELSPELSQLVMALLERSPDDRIASANVLRQELRVAIAGKTAGRSVVGDRKVATASTASGAVRPPERARRSNLFYLLTLTAILSILAASRWHGRRPQGPAPADPLVLAFASSCDQLAVDFHEAAVDRPLSAFTGMEPWKESVGLARARFVESGQARRFRERIRALTPRFLELAEKILPRLTGEESDEAFANAAARLLDTSLAVATLDCAPESREGPLEVYLSHLRWFQYHQLRWRLLAGPVAPSRAAPAPHPLSSGAPLEGETPGDYLGTGNSLCGELYTAGYTYMSAAVGRRCLRQLHARAFDPRLDSTLIDGLVVFCFDRFEGSYGLLYVVDRVQLVRISLADKKKQREYYAGQQALERYHSASPQEERAARRQWYTAHMPGGVRRTLLDRARWLIDDALLEPDGWLSHIRADWKVHTGASRRICDLVLVLHELGGSEEELTALANRSRILAEGNPDSTCARLIHAAVCAIVSGQCPQFAAEIQSVWTAVERLPAGVQPASTVGCTVPEGGTGQHLLENAGQILWVLSLGTEDRSVDEVASRFAVAARNPHPEPAEILEARRTTDEWIFRTAASPKTANGR